MFSFNKIAIQQQTPGTPQQYPNQMMIRPNMAPQQQMVQNTHHQQQQHFIQQQQQQHHTQQHLAAPQQNGVIPQQAQVNNSHLNQQHQAPPNVTVSSQNGHMNHSSSSMLNFLNIRPGLKGKKIKKSINKFEFLVKIQKKLIQGFT